MEVLGTAFGRHLTRDLPACRRFTDPWAAVHWCHCATPAQLLQQLRAALLAGAGAQGLSRTAAQRGRRARAAAGAAAAAAPHARRISARC